MEQGSAGIVGNEVNFHLLVSHEHDDILDDPGCRPFRDTGQFKAVAMQMHGMDVVAGVAHAQSIALALAQVKHRLHFLHRECDVFDAPFVEALIGAVVFGETSCPAFRPASAHSRSTFRTGCSPT
jgi:hypothetical protein